MSEAVTAVMPHPVVDDGKRLLHSEITVGAARLFVRDAFPDHRKEDGKDGSPAAFGDTSVMLHLFVPDRDAAAERAAAAGATVVMAPWDAFWGDRYAQVADPFGHRWSFADHLETVPA